MDFRIGAEYLKIKHISNYQKKKLSKFLPDHNKTSGNSALLIEIDPLYPVCKLVI